jgi:hypothetical protein
VPACPWHVQEFVQQKGSYVLLWADHWFLCLQSKVLYYYIEIRGGQGNHNDHGYDKATKWLNAFI